VLKNLALITIIQNGNQLFKIWYQYYSKLIAPQNIYIIDYNSSDGSVDGLNCNIIRNDEFQIENVPQGNGLINRLKSELLKKYKYVAYTDYDEILYHPKGFDYLLSCDQEYYTTQGYEIVQNRAVEQTINFEESILQQRKFWYRCLDYDKPLITKVDFKWAHGNHSAIIETKNNNIILQPKYFDYLILIHLHKVDYIHCLSLNQNNVAVRGQPVMGGNHNFLIGHEFEKWWQSFERYLSPIPAEILEKNII